MRSPRKCLGEANGFRVGDEIIIHKPMDTEELPYWLPAMNMYDGLVTTITEIEAVNNRNDVFTKATKRYCFNMKWIEHVEENLELDDEELTSFIGGFASHG